MFSSKFRGLILGYEDLIINTLYSQINYKKTKSNTSYQSENKLLQYPGTIFTPTLKSHKFDY